MYIIGQILASCIKMDSNPKKFPLHCVSHGRMPYPGSNDKEDINLANLHEEKTLARIGTD